jgi:hypothetical protein
MNLLIRRSVIIISSKFDKAKAGRKIKMHLCDLKYSGKAIMKGDFFYSDEISMKSTAFLKGTVKIDGPTFAASSILIFLICSLNCYSPIM